MRRAIGNSACRRTPGLRLRFSDDASSQKVQIMTVTPMPVISCHRGCSRSAADPAANPARSASSSENATGGRQPATAAKPMTTTAAGATMAGICPEKTTASTAAAAASPAASTDNGSRIPKSTKASPISAASDNGEVKRCALAVQIDVSAPKFPCAQAMELLESDMTASKAVMNGLGNTGHACQNPHACRSNHAPARTQGLRTTRQRLDQPDGNACQMQ